MLNYTKMLCRTLCPPPDLNLRLHPWMLIHVFVPLRQSWMEQPRLHRLYHVRKNRKRATRSGMIRWRLRCKWVRKHTMSGNALAGPEGRAVHSGIERRPGNKCGRCCGWRSVSKIRSFWQRLWLQKTLMSSFFIGWLKDSALSLTRLPKSWSIMVKPCLVLTILQMALPHFQSLATPSNNENFDKEYFSQVEADMAVIEEICAKTEGSLEPTPVTAKEIRNRIRSFKNGKAQDIHGLTAEHLKHAMDEVCQPLADLMNYILSCGYIPPMMLEGLVTPVPKKDKDATLPTIIGELRSCPLLGKCWKSYSRNVRKLSYLRTSPGCSAASRRSPHLSTQPSWFRKCRMRRKIVVNRLHLWRWMPPRRLT